jgi:hypothetical protein
MSRRRFVMSTTVLSMGILAGAVLASLVFGGRALSFVGDAIATPTGETYLLSDFTIEYPYVSLEPSAETDAAKAGVSFTAQWSGDGFPGEAPCVVTLRDGAGDVVGSTEFPASLASEPATPHFPVSVSGPPVSAEGTCGEGRYDPGPGYTFDDLTIAQSDDAGVTVFRFVSHWATEGHPNWRSCQFQANLDDGTVLTHTFGFSAPDGALYEEYARVGPDQVRDATVTCREVG